MPLIEEVVADDKDTKVDSMLSSLNEVDSNIKDSNELKEMGNYHYMAKELGQALSCYSSAIELNPNNHILYSNRSMCYIAMEEYDLALKDSIQCVELNEDFLKGYFHKATCEIELNLYKDATLTIMTGMSFENGQSEIDYDVKSKSKPKSKFDRLTRLLKKKKLENETKDKGTDINNSEPKKQSIKNFTMGEELGIGNFSKISIAICKFDNKKYALKMIEKAEVDRMKKRHPNIHNEIAMEKRVLAKLAGNLI